MEAARIPQTTHDTDVNDAIIAFLIIVRTGKICVYGYSRPVAYYDLFGLL